MTTITTRSGKGSALTHAEVDNNFTSLNTDKIETSAIGSSVQAYDSNLTSFVGAFTLPTTDGTSGQVLVTDGSGGLSFGAPPAGSPSGAVMYFAMSTAPSGWLKANGAAISRSAYSDLFAAIGTTYGSGDGSSTFNLPDLRGQFLRAWDDSRGVDSGRSFASSQATQNKSQSISITTSNPGNFITGSVNASLGGSSGYIGSTSGVFSRSSGTTNHVATAGYYPSTFYRNFSISAGSHTHTATVNVSGGSESRPTNVALLACIKY